MAEALATRVAWVLTLLALSGFLCGCARYQPKPLAPALTADEFERRSLTDEGLRHYLEANHETNGWPRSSWNLRGLTLAAFYYHPDLDVARERWSVAQAGKTTAGERPNPSLNVTPGYDTTTLTPSPWIPLGFLDIPIETAGKRGYRVAQATHLSEAARLNIASVAWRVRSGVRRALVELSAASEAEALLREQQSLQIDNLRLVQRQQDQGAVSAFELTQAGIAADSARLALRDAERQKAEAQVRLAEAIGIPASALEGVKFSFDGLGQLPNDALLVGARRQALLRRPDILAALAEYAASQSALQLEVARQYPDVHLGPGYQYDQGDSKWSLAITVTLPVLNQNQGPIAEAKAKRAELAARFNALQAGVLSAVDQATTGYRAAVQKQADADALLSRLQGQEKRARDMFETGDISGAELVALRLQLSVSALARLDARAKAQQAVSALEDAIQIPLAPEGTFGPWEQNPRLSNNQAIAK